jgi:hypothetical protein
VEYYGFASSVIPTLVLDNSDCLRTWGLGDMRGDTNMSSFAAVSFGFIQLVVTRELCEVLQIRTSIFISVLIFELLRLAEEMEPLPLSTRGPY